jgi:hypothetical protein
MTLLGHGTGVSSRTSARACARGGERGLDLGAQNGEIADQHQRADRRPFRRIDAADIGDIGDLIAKAHPDPATIKSCETHNLFPVLFNRTMFFY